jgi:hypothetical protein
MEIVCEDKMCAHNPQAALYLPIPISIMALGATGAVGPGGKAMSEHWYHTLEPSLHLSNVDCIGPLHLPIPIPIMTLGAVGATGAVGPERKSISEHWNQALEPPFYPNGADSIGRTHHLLRIHLRGGKGDEKRKSSDEKLHVFVWMVVWPIFCFVRTKSKENELSHSFNGYISKNLKIQFFVRLC